MIKFRFRQVSPALVAKLAEYRKENGIADPLPKPGTVCEIVAESEQFIDGEKIVTEEVISNGSARLVQGDQFCRALGRKISAGRAIRGYIPRLGRRDVAGASARKALWDSLFAVSPKTRDCRGV